MALHNVPTIYPGNVHWTAHCRNGLIPNATFMRQVLDGHNFVAAYRHKQVFAISQNLASIDAGAASTVNHWRFRFHAGNNVDELVFFMGVARTDNASAADPYVFWTVTPTGGAAVNTNELHIFNLDTSPDDAPDEFAWQKIRYTIPTRDTTYECEMRTVDYARPFSCLAYTTGSIPVDDTLAGVCDPTVSYMSPIHDIDQLDVHEAGTVLWQNNAAHVMSYSSQAVADSHSQNSATYTNIFDASTGTPSASTQGIQFDLTSHNSYSRTTVPVVLSVYGQRTAGAGTITNNTLQLIDTAGTTLISVSSIGNTEQWYNATGTLPTGSIKADLQLRTDAADTIRIDAVSIFEHE